MEFEGEELQEPTGEPYRKDSWIYTGFPDSSPKCCLCKNPACSLIAYGVNKWLCDDCLTNPLVSTLTIRNKFEREHPEIFPPEKTPEELWANHKNMNFSY